MADHSSDQAGLRPGRACRPCVKIKAKCVPLENSELSICQRCHRLGKLCTTPKPLQQRKPHTASTEREPRATLASVTPRTWTEQRTVPLTPASEQFNAPSHEQNASTSSTDEATLTLGHAQGFSRHAAKLIEVSPELGHVYGTTFHETLFQLFRERIIRFFPFVNMSQMTSAVTISSKQPFFYTCCVLIAAHRDPPLQARIGRDILRYVGEHMLLRGEKSMDMLQGLLVLTAWFSSYSLNQPQLMNVYHLAKALLIDLGLNSEAGKGIFQIKLANDAARVIHGGGEPDQPGALQAKRACLGLFHAHTQYYHAFHRLDPPVWSKHIDSCLQTLHMTQQDYQDTYAVGLLQLDQLFDKYAGSQAIEPGSAMPIQAYIRLFSKDLEDIKAGLPAKLQQDRNFQLHIYHTELFLIEQAAFSNGHNSAHTIEALHLCLTAVISFVDHICAQKSQDVPDTPFINWIMLAHAFDTLARLLFYDASGWDLEYARNSPGFHALSDRVIEKLNSIRAAEELEHGIEKSAKFRLFADRVNSFKQWYNDKVRAESRTSGAVAVPDGDRNNDLANSTMDIPLFNDFSHLLWQDFDMSYPRFDNDLNFF